ncbi:MAG: hypothetical protein B5M53_03390 [Candidatus Cloacimonas sp. 4484_209]|nr:MAG: hypothetical protein B5M53_03390 [Candidatus Cloacimonas sp. 4484_209]
MIEKKENYKMKNGFCNVFLFLFAMDGILSLFGGTITLLGSNITQTWYYQIFGGIFSFGIVVCAIVQITIGFVKKLRWSARIIGMYVIFYSIMGPIIAFLYGLYLGMQGMSAMEARIFGLRSTFMNIYSVIIGFIQIVLFFWALKDLSKGHYLSKG